MARHRNEHVKKALAWVASVALVAGLVPIPALAFAEEAGDPGPDAPAAVEANEADSQPGAAPAPDAAAVPQVAKPAAPDAGAEAAPAEGGQAVAGDGAGNGAEGQPDEAAGPDGAQVADPAEAYDEGNADANEAEDANDVEEAEKAEAEGNGEEDAEDGADKDEKAEFPAFSQSQTVDGVTVTVEADEGAFPEDAKLSVTSAPASATEAAVAQERDENENVAVSYTFDVKVLDKDGEELQPKDGKSVRVSFAAAEVADPNLDVIVYHVSGGAAEELPVSESGSTATAESNGFSYYTVEFTYNNLQYVLQGDSEIPLAEILSAVGLVGEPTDAVSSNPDLFGAEKKDGGWTVCAKQAFSTPEVLTVTVNGAEYAIAVTDEIIDSGMCGDHLGWWLDDEGTLTIGGWGPMNIFTVEDRPWHSQSTSITSVVIENGATSITHDAFSGCTKLTNVIIPSSMQEIWSDAFQQCTSLTSVVIPDSVTSISYYAFGECSNLASVTISSGETTIEYDAFHYCYNLKDVYYGGTEEEWNQVKYRFPEKVKVHYIVTATANDANGGTAEGGGNYTAGTEIALIATPKSGYVFDCWTENGRPVEGAGAKYTFTVTEGRTLVANFRQVWIGDIADQAYTGSAIEPKDLHVELIGVDGASSNEVLIEGEDYTLSYENNVNAGEAAVIVTLDNRFSGEAKAAFNILQADLSTATVEAADQVYDGTALEPTPTVTWDGKQVAKEDYTATYLGNVRAGTATVTVTGKCNFKDTTSTSGTFEIKKRPVTITADSAEKAYDGEPLTADGFTSEGLAEGDRVESAKVEGSQTEAGSSANEVSDARVVNATGEDVTACYEIAYVPGTLTVEPAEATITVEGASKVEGEADPAFSGTVEGLVKDGDLGEIRYVRTGSDEAPGTYKGVLTATYTDNPNYDVAVVNGDFTIEPAPAKKAALTFDLAGGTLDGKTGTITIEANVGDTIKLPGAPTREGCAFKCWRGSEYAAGADYKVEGDHAFTAVWAHTVTFDANGHGTAPAAQQVEDGKAAKKPADPKASGWTFGGWYTDKECTKAYDFSTPVTEDITLYAKWTQGAKATPSASKPSSGSTARTGDGLPLAVPIALALAAISGLALAGFALRGRGTHATIGRHARR